VQNSLSPQCTTSVVNNSSCVEDRAVKFACSMAFLAMAVVWPPSLSRGRIYTHCGGPLSCYLLKLVVLCKLMRWVGLALKNGPMAMVRLLANITLSVSKSVHIITCTVWTCDIQK